MAETKNKPYLALLALIPKGKKNGISRKVLAETLRISPRDVSRLVSLARRDSIIIASGNDGYYYPSSYSEALSYFNSERKKAIAILQSLKTVRKDLKQNGFIGKGK